MSAGSDVKPLPSLDAFDEEFGREQADIAGENVPRSGFRLLTFIALALAAGLITALALGWSNLSGTPPSEVEPGASSSQALAESQATINRLRRELEALQKENRELQEAQQAANATLQSDERGNRGSFVTWYSNLPALTYGIPVQEAGTTGRRSATARSKPRETPPRDETGPVSLEPPQ
jgi:hypothetical protein